MEKQDTRATYGMTVTLVDEKTKEQTQFFLVRAEEENWQEKKISMYHPIGKFIFTKVAGTLVQIQAADGSLRDFRITQIEPT